MHDNGPVYVVEDGRLRKQNWAFDAWGGAFGADVSHRLDDEVPAKVAEATGLPVDYVAIVHERGNLEFNGVDTVMLNWSKRAGNGVIDMRGGRLLGAEFSSGRRG